MRSEDDLRIVLFKSKGSRYSFNLKKARGLSNNGKTYKEIAEILKASEKEIEKYLSSGNKRPHLNRKQDARPASTRTLVKKLKLDAIKQARQRPCADCKKTFPPVVMDLDHLPKFEKKFNLSQAQDRSLDEVLKEIAKCEAVCANCHRIRTAQRYGTKAWKEVQAFLEESLPQSENVEETEDDEEVVEELNFDAP